MFHINNLPTADTSLQGDSKRSITLKRDNYEEMLFVTFYYVFPDMQSIGANKNG